MDRPVSAEEIAAIDRALLRKLISAKRENAQRPKTVTKRAVMAPLEEWMEVFIPGVETPEKAVELFLDGALEQKEYEVITSPRKNIAMMIPWSQLKRNKVYIQVVQGVPFQIKGWIWGREVDRRHKKGDYALIFGMDPIFRHPKGLLDTFWRGTARENR